MSDETRAKFLAAIAAKVGADRVEEVHLFPPIKQGGMESGVAVVAVRAGVAEPADPAVTPPHGDPLAGHIADESAGPAVAENPEPRAENRLTVYTAKYRLTLKGPERGKWEFAIQAEADAPLITVETVVRGVQRRSGDVDDPEKVSGDDFRGALPAADAAKA